MLSILSQLPYSFWLAMLSFILVGYSASIRIKTGLGIPMLAVLGTVFFWYVVDVFYNDYKEVYIQRFGYDVLVNSWLQVAEFLVAFWFFVIVLNKGGVGKISTSYLVHLRGVSDPVVQLMIDRFFGLCLAAWLLLVVFAFFSVGVSAIWFVFPIAGQSVDPFARAQIGGGYSAFLSFAHYLHILVAAGMGIVAAMTSNRRVFWVAVTACLLIWPFFIFDRTRSNMIAVILPAGLAWVFYRLRASLFRRLTYLAVMAFLLNIWFSFVMEARNHQVGVGEMFLQVGAHEIIHAKAKHLGLNMYEELCWLNTLISRGEFEPNWGRRYFAELVNPIPRALWAGKPTIGLDYAIARGQSVMNDKGMVTATISTGMIGQGVDNFGLFLGPIASALLVAVWVTVLERMDTMGKVTLRFPLYLVGLILTFNLGRDVTLLVLYPFLFGWLLIYASERKNGRDDYSS